MMRGVKGGRVSKSNFTAYDGVTDHEVEGVDLLAEKAEPGDKKCGCEPPRAK